MSNTTSSKCNFSVFNHELFKEITPHILAEFIKFHKDHPKMYHFFVKFAKEAKKSGRTRFGIAMIAERIRWHVEIETRGDFKINNNHKACYARLLMIQDPYFKTMFQRRSQVR